MTWGTTPPTEPGWYFWRADPNSEPVVLSCWWNIMQDVFVKAWPLQIPAKQIGGEWHSERIPEPSDD